MNDNKTENDDVIKVLVVDDSALARRLLTEVLETDPMIKVVGTAIDPYIAREKIKKLNPDVITLDIEMPRMDGLTFLEKLMRLRPMPVVMASTLTEKGAETTLRALELGAVDFITKPKLDMQDGIRASAPDITSKIKIAAGVRNFSKPKVERLNTLVDEKHSADAVLRKCATKTTGNTESVVVLGASTGGTEAIKHVLCGLPTNCPAILITQHIPESFSVPFTERMNRETALNVHRAEQGMPVKPGNVYIAPGDQHLLIERKNASYVCKISGGPAVNRHRPAVDVLFRSAAQEVGHNAVGVLLTGMGDDGAQGLLELRDVGGRTIAQDEASSVVWGMPGAAHRLGAVEELHSLAQVAGAIMSKVKMSRLVGT